MIAALLFALGFVLGWLVPRDAFGWMRVVSAWFMRNRDNRKLAWWLIVLALGIFFITLNLTGCSRREAELTTGRVIPAAELTQQGRAFAGDTAYAEVQSAALPGFYENFRSVLSKQGLVKWDERYDCNHFAALYVALAQTQFTVAAWHSTTKAQTLALAEIWYRRDNGGGHAIVLAATELGWQFIEPQTGREIFLSETERKSIFLAKW